MPPSRGSPAKLTLIFQSANRTVHLLYVWVQTTREAASCYLKGFLEGFSDALTLSLFKKVGWATNLTPAGLILLAEMSSECRMFLRAGEGFFEVWDAVHQPKRIPNQISTWGSAPPPPAPPRSPFSSYCAVHWSWYCQCRQWHCMEKSVAQVKGREMYFMSLTSWLVNEMLQKTSTTRLWWTKPADTGEAGSPMRLYRERNRHFCDRRRPHSRCGYIPLSGLNNFQADSIHFRVILSQAGRIMHQ